jgi:hypothetical protein
MSPADAEVKARSVLDHLIRQRQRMRAEAADAGELEANRLGIVYWQWQLNKALQARQHAV